MNTSGGARAGRVGGSVGVVVALLGATHVAEGANPEPGELWIGAEAYAGYTSGTFRFEGPVNPGYGQTGALVFTPRVSGGVVGLSVFVGIALADRLAIGAITHPSLFFGSTHGDLGASAVNGGAQGGLELAAQYWIHPEWHTRLSFGVASASFFGSTNDIGSADNIVEFEPMTGPIGHLLLGWKPRTIGAFMRGGFAYLEADQSRYTPFDVVVGVSFASL